MCVRYTVSCAPAVGLSNASNGAVGSGCSRWASALYAWVSIHSMQGLPQGGGGGVARERGNLAEAFACSVAVCSRRRPISTGESRVEESRTWFSGSVFAEDVGCSCPCLVSIRALAAPRLPWMKLSRSGLIHPSRWSTGVQYIAVRSRRHYGFPGACGPQAEQAQERGSARLCSSGQGGASRLEHGEGTVILCVVSLLSPLPLLPRPRPRPPLQFPAKDLGAFVRMRPVSTERVGLAYGWCLFSPGVVVYIAVGRGLDH